MFQEPTIAKREQKCDYVSCAVDIPWQKVNKFIVTDKSFYPEVITGKI